MRHPGTAGKIGDETTTVWAVEVEDMQWPASANAACCKGRVVRVGFFVCLFVIWMLCYAETGRKRRDLETGEPMYTCMQKRRDVDP